MRFILLPKTLHKTLKITKLKLELKQETQLNTIEQLCIDYCNYLVIDYGKIGRLISMTSRPRRP